MVDQQLLDYIKQQLQQSVSREQIKSSLINNGWQENDINEAFTVLSNNPASSLQESISRPALQNDMQNLNEPLKKNYILFSIILILFLIAFFLPKSFSYVELIKTRLVIVPGISLFASMPELIIGIIGKSFSVFFMLFPGVILAFLIRKYLHTSEGKIVFLKIPFIILFLAVLLSFPIVYFVSLAVPLLGMAGPQVPFFIQIIVSGAWLVISLLASFFVFFTNKGYKLKNKITNLLKFKSTRIFYRILFIAVILFSFFSVTRFYISSILTENLEQKNILTQFPESFGLTKIKTNVSIDNSGVTTYGSPGIQNYNKLYIQDYSTCLSIHNEGDYCFDNYDDFMRDRSKYSKQDRFRDLQVIVYTFRDIDVLMESLKQKGLMVVNDEITNQKYSRSIGGMEDYSLSSLNINGCNIAKFTQVVSQTKQYYDIRIAYLWVSKKQNYIIQVITQQLNDQPQNIDEELIKNLSSKFGC